MKIFVPPLKDAYLTPSAASDLKKDVLGYCRAYSLYPIPSR
jgi:hypothetical protein